MILFAYFPARRETFHCNWSELKCRNLGDLLDDAVDPERDEKFVVPITNGPDGKSGGLAAVGADPFECDVEAATFKPERCEWYQSGNNWIGWIKGQKPGPEDLRRNTLQPGVATKMGDGNSWKVPLVSFFPRLFHRDDEGHVVEEEIRDEPQKTLHALAHEFGRHIAMNRHKIIASDLRSEQVYLPGSETLADGLLRLNYRWAPKLYANLGLWTPESLLETVLATTAIRLAADAELRRRAEERDFTSDN